MIQRTLLLIACIFAYCPVAVAEDAPERLFGDWSGIHSSLSESGIESEAVATVDSMSNVSGGAAQESALLGNFDLGITVDTEKAGLWTNGTFFFYGLANFGDSISERAGDLQGVDNIEAYGTAKLYEAWYEHAIGSQASVLFGLHDYNSEFYVLEHASGLMNSSFGIGVDASQVGPSIFPSTGWVGRLRVEPTEQSYLLLATYDGIPGSAYDQVGTQIGWSADEGYFHAAEVGIVGTEDDYYKLGLGTWWHTTDFVDYSDRERSNNVGVYTIGELNFSDSFGGFLQFGWADGDKNQTVRYYGAGVTYAGLLSHRPEDLLSIGCAIAENSDDFKRNYATDSAEATFEANYRIQATPYLAVTPDIQFVLNPGTDPAMSDAVVIGFRTELVL